MKGIVFDLLNEMVEERFGFEAWQTLLDATGLDGIYVATETYPDEQLVQLVCAAEQATGILASDLTKAFGEFMMPHFAEQYPVFFENQTNMKSFLLTVDQVIHVEVRKLYPEAGLPAFEYEDLADDKLTMSYRSPRKMCRLAEGLLAGAANHFQQSYELEHETCMHTGSDHCLLEITFT